MRFTIRKFATWLFTAGCIFLVTFNFYNRHVWVMTSGTRPWGQDFDSEIEHERVHHPHMPTHIELVTYNRSNVVVLNKSSANENLKHYKQTTLKPGEILWPDLEFYDDDRILSQLRYKPSSLAQGSDENPPLKKIIVYSGLGSWNVKRGRQQFIDQKCLVNTCELADNKADADHADAVLVNSPVRPWTKRPPHQIWIIFQLESPYHSPGLNGFSNVFNWTATYRHDSDIVAPYERFTPYNEHVLTLPQNRSYAEGKTKQVAWFVSNCGGRNGRQNYVQELSKHINVDIYGSCGKLKCPRHSAQKCFDMLNKDYKFYLAFENSNCRDYITEKFFVNGLQHDVIPIVMGAAPEDYKRAAPPHSYIHVEDFESPKELAEYLIKLDQNDDMYNEYFRWKGTGSNINTFFWCRICAMLHKSRESHSYRDLERWWRGPEVCIGMDKWRDHPRKSKYIVQDFL